MGYETEMTSVGNMLSKLVSKLGSNHALYTIVEQTPNGVIVVNLDHKILYGNIATCNFTGNAYGEINGLNIHDILGLAPDDQLAILLNSLNSIALPKRHFRHEMKIFNKLTNNFRSLEIVILEPEADNNFYILILIDIDDRKQLEIELRRRNSFFHNLIDSSVDGIISSNMKGKIILFNQGAQELLGYTEEEAKNNVHVTELYPEGEGYNIINRMRSNDYGGKGRLIRHELVSVTKDGHQIPTSLSGGIIYDHGREIATFGIFTDLRKIQQVEESLQQTHQMLQQSEKMAGLGRLAAGVAHEINNPMSGIMLYSNLVKEELGENHHLTKDLEIIIHEAERCKTIVQDLLEFSHQTTYDMNNVDINEIVLKTLNLLRMQPLFHNIEINLKLDKLLKKISGSNTKLNQVVMNILVNCSQAMKGKGKLTIQSRNRSNGDIIELLISDTGPGIDKEDLPRIFDPFFTTKAHGEGTGLGLSVSYAIVREHKGSIRATSAESGGALFTLRFPAFEHADLGAIQ